MEEKICCFTGHRPEGLPWGTDETKSSCEDVKGKLRDRLSKLYADGYRHFITGMARGADLLCAELVLSMKNTGHDIMLEAAIPHVGQEAHWNVRDREYYHSVLARADKQTILAPTYTRGCMQARNRYMVDKSSYVIALYDGKSRGGTYFTVRYAQKNDVPVYPILLNIYE